MDLELLLHPDDALALLRLKNRGAATETRTKESRARTQAARIVWHDSAGYGLMERGLALAEQKSGWSLERLCPGRECWPPGTPPPLLETASSVAGLMEDMPPLLVPVAAFEGKQTQWTVTPGHEPVSLRLLRGELRAVTARHPVCRLVITGEDTAVRLVAMELATRFRLSVPRTSLAAEALATATGIPSSPRRLGAPSLPDGDGMGVADAFRHVLGHLTDVILYWAPAAAANNAGPEPVHQMRVAVRRARSCILAFHDALRGPALQSASDGLKTLGAQLGPARDWDVFCTETAPRIAAAFPDDPALAKLIAAAGRRQRDCHTALEQFLPAAEFRLMGIELAWLAGSPSWCVAADPARQDQMDLPLADFARAVIQKRWKKLVGAGKDIEAQDVPALHDIRLRAKRARYAAEIFTALYTGKGTNRFLRRLSSLQEALGVLNDGAVAAILMRELGGPTGRHGYAVGLVQGFLGAAAAGIRPDILQAWEKFRRQEPFWS